VNVITVQKNTTIFRGVFLTVQLLRHRFRLKHWEANSSAGNGVIRKAILIRESTLVAE
jgi:hypothetical protein